MTAVRAYMWDKAGREGVILCGRQFMNSLDDSSMEEVKAAIRSEPWLLAAFEIGEKFIRTKSRRISYKFAGLDRSLDSLKSKSRILLCWVDEAEPVTEEAWVKLIPTLREEDSELWVTWNPESPRSPTHRRFREGPPDPRVKIVQLNWRDNPWFPSVLQRTKRRDFEQRPEQYEHIWEGGFRLVYEGAYYAKDLAQSREQGRICAVPVVPDLPVHTAWDLGKGANMAVWLWQIGPEGLRIVRYVEGEIDDGIPAMVEKLEKLGYRYGDDWVPHDAKVKEIGSQRTRIERLVALGRRPRIVKDHRVADGIEAVHATIPKCWFDATHTEYGLDALRQYRSEYDEDKYVFSEAPRHDWTSHAADSFRHLAMAWKEVMAEIPKPDPPKQLVYEVKDGRLTANMSVRDIIEMKKKRRLADG